MDHSPEFKAVIQAFRKVLKAKKITYEELAARLGTSAQTVKRLVNGYGDCSLEKLIAACRAAEVEFFDLVKLAGEPPERSFSLSVEQEQFLVEHPHHHAVFTLLRDKKSVAAIAAEYALTLDCMRRYLRELEGAGLCERLPGDGVKVPFAGAHDWLMRGPLHRHSFRSGLAAMAEHFLREDVVGTDMRLQTWSSTQLSQPSIDALMTEITDLATRYRRLVQRERATLPKEQLLDVEWCFLAAAPFRVELDRKPVEL